LLDDRPAPPARNRPAHGSFRSRSTARPSPRATGIVRRKAFAQEWREIAARLIEYAATNEIRACASLGRLEHLTSAVEVRDERIDLSRLATRRRHAGL